MMECVKHGAVVYIGFFAPEVVHSPFIDGAIVKKGLSTDTIFSYSTASNRSAYEAGAAGEKQFIADKMAFFLERDPETKFMLFCPDGYKEDLPPVSLDKICCFNGMSLYELTNSKIYARYWLSAYAPMIPSTVVRPRGDISYAELTHEFHCADGLVVQDEYGRGGYQTNLITSQAQIQEQLLASPEDASRRMIISPYRRNDRSINQHIIIPDGEPLLFPPSVQKIVVKDSGAFSYAGADYAAYADEVSPLIDSQIDEHSQQIARALQRTGYRGVLGIDYLVTDTEVFFVEINPRFQTSSGFLARELTRQGLPDLYELNYAAFYLHDEEYWRALQQPIAHLAVHQESSYYDYLMNNGIEV
jgi:hypothetical protein